MRIEKRDGVLWMEVSPDQVLDMLSDVAATQESPKTKYAEREAAGTCAFCDKPRVEGRKVCAEHLKGLQKRMAKARAKR